MKKIIFLTLLALYTTITLGQNAYIQVDGEPNLSVFLNNKFKAKTTTEIGGCVIENVTPGKNLIKIVKEGFIPFEETITLKSGEVFSYKVKPFIKNKVTIEESGNSGETDKKAAVATGKLIIQSVPINIKITIPSIEGINNTIKAKDEWIVNNISAGTCEATFTFNKKSVKKSFEIIGGETTNVFINMMNDDFKTRNSIDEKIKITTFIDSIATTLKSNALFKREEFKNNKAVAGNQSMGVFSSGIAALLAQPTKPEQGLEMDADQVSNLEKYSYSIAISKKNKMEVANQYNKIVAEIKNFSEMYRTIGLSDAKLTNFEENIHLILNNKKLQVIFETVK